MMNFASLYQNGAPFSIPKGAPGRIYLLFLKKQGIISNFFGKNTCKNATYAL